MALATKEPTGILTVPATCDVNNFFCAVLRSETPEWLFSSDPITAQAFLDLASEQGLQALVFEKMADSAAWIGWPDAVKERLAIARREGIAIDLMRAHHVSQFLEKLQQRRIPFLITKGEALAHTLYPEPGLRPRVDTDLFIPLDQIESVRQVFLEAGYQVIPPIYKTHQFMAVSPAGDFRLTFDVHWRILNSAQYARTLDFYELQAHSVPVPGIENARTPGLIDSLLLACMHRCGSEWHDRERLLWLFDIHLMILNLDAVGWDDLISRSIGKGVQSSVRDSLMLAAQKLSSPVPDEVLSQFQLLAAENTSLFKRVGQSNLGLLADDWIHLPNYKSRFNLLRELFCPSPRELEELYGKRSRWALFMLSIVYVLSRTFSRLRLR